MNKSKAARIGLVFLFVFNLIDAVVTDHVLARGMATELNPLMDHLYTLSPAGFLVVKVLAGFSLVLALWDEVWGRHARRLIFVATACYGVLVVYEGWMLWYLYR